jgi:hypothetical protein
MSGHRQHRFEVGETYDSNRRGDFTVIKLDGDNMTVKWKDGETVTLSAREQEKILNNYEEEFINLGDASHLQAKKTPRKRKG